MGPSRPGLATRPGPWIVATTCTRVWPVATRTGAYRILSYQAVSYLNLTHPCLLLSDSSPASRVRDSLSVDTASPASRMDVSSYVRLRLVFIRLSQCLSGEAVGLVFSPVSPAINRITSGPVLFSMSLVLAELVVLSTLKSLPKHDHACIHDNLFPSQFNPGNISMPSTTDNSS